MKAWIRGAAVLLATMTCLCACGSPNKTPDTDGETPPPITETSKPLVISENGATEYQLVCQAELLEDNQGMQGVIAFVDHFKQKTGAAISYCSDRDAKLTGKEILVGAIRRHDASAQAMESLTSPNGTGYRIRVSEDSVLVSCGEPALLGSALASVLSGLEETEKGTFGFPENFTVSMDLPTFSEEIEPVVCYTGEGNYTATYGATNYMTYREYLDRLKAEGFYEHSSSQMGRNYFATYVKEVKSEKMAVHLMFYERMFRFEMTYGPMDEFLPPAEVMETGSEGTATPSITQLARKGSLAGAPGMSAILQLSDASFVIFDGGPYDTEDSMDLYNFMKQRTPEGQKPVIAAWFITHAHGDHMGLALDFLRSHKNDVILRLGAFNFPDFDTIRINNESAANMRDMANSFKSLVQSYPDAEYWVMHTGQTLKLPDCEIRVMYTPEDAASTEFAWGNHTCTAVRITMNDTTFTVLGDAERSLCQQMADAYGSSLKSDILSLSHHGFNGACLDLYKCVNPDVCFWPVDGYRFMTDPRCLGTEHGYDFNAWLRNDAIKVREHYAADETKTIYC